MRPLLTGHHERRRPPIDFRGSWPSRATPARVERATSLAARHRPDRPSSSSAAPTRAEVPSFRCYHDIKMYASPSRHTPTARAHAHAAMMPPSKAIYGGHCADFRRRRHFSPAIALPLRLSRHIDCRKHRSLQRSRRLYRLRWPSPADKRFFITISRRIICFWITPT